MGRLAPDRAPLMTLPPALRRQVRSAPGTNGSLWLGPGCASERQVLRLLGGLVSLDRVLLPHLQLWALVFSGNPTPRGAPRKQTPDT